MATLNGVDMFGLCVCKTAPMPARRQLNRYPGVNGLESKRMGTDGKRSMVSGFLVGVTTEDINAAEGVLQSYLEDGGAYTFVDNYGNQWPRVYLLEYDFTDRVMKCAAAPMGGAGHCRPYVATLIHLI